MTIKPVRAVPVDDSVTAREIVDPEFIREHGGAFVEGEYLSDEFIQSEIREIIHWGYEQLSSNDEGLTDAGDAMRLYFENINLHPSQAMIAFLEPLVEAAFEKEFKWQRENRESLW